MGAFLGFLAFVVIVSAITTLFALLTKHWKVAGSAGIVMVLGFVLDGVLLGHSGSTTQPAQTSLPSPAVSTTAPGPRIAALPTKNPSAFKIGTAIATIKHAMGDPCTTYTLDGAKGTTPGKYLAYCDSSGDNIVVMYYFEHDKLNEEPTIPASPTPIAEMTSIIKKAAGDTSTDAPVADAPAPEPTPDLHAKRVEYHDFWNKTVGNLAMVYVCLNYAAKAEVGGDDVTASKFLSQGENFAANAEHATYNDVPSDWDNDQIKLNLWDAANKLKDGLAKARSYLDDNKPSEMAEAQDDAQQARGDVDAATEAAQASYVSMGGKASDLETMQDQAQGVIKSFDSLFSN